MFFLSFLSTAFFHVFFSFSTQEIYQLPIASSFVKFFYITLIFTLSVSIWSLCIFLTFCSFAYASTQFGWLSIHSFSFVSIHSMSSSIFVMSLESAFSLSLHLRSYWSLSNLSSIKATGADSMTFKLNKQQKKRIRYELKSMKSKWKTKNNNQIGTAKVLLVWARMKGK